MKKNKSNQSSPSNKDIKKQRVVRYFIDAAREIISKEGIERITIRNVAERAGYNSASLYNYFENLEELLAYACIDLIADWLKDLMHIIEGEGDELDKYIWGWRSFCEHSFKNPAIFAYIYSSGESGSVIQYFGSYFSVFSEVYENIPENFVKMYQQDTLRGQEEVIIQPCIREGFFSKENAENVYNVALLLHNGLLWKAIEIGNNEEYKEYVEVYMKYFLDYVKIWLKKDKDLSLYLK